MSSKTQAPVNATTKPSLNADKSGLLQRKCACSNSAGLTGECATCQKEKLTLQRKQTATQGDVSEVPPIVHEVLNSPGQPLDSETRSFMESRFNQDFSQVRIHTDVKAGKSAQAVNAEAFTVNRDIVFNTGYYTPDTKTGKQLLAHKLTHVMQQTGLGELDVQLNGPQAEAQADRAAEKAVRLGSHVSGIGQTAQGLARSEIDPVKSSTEVKKEHQGNLDHLKELLIAMLSALQVESKASIDRNSTILVALMENIDDNNEPVTEYVYTANGNWNSGELEKAANQLGILRATVNPRAEGPRKETQAASDTEQLLIEYQIETDGKILGMAVLRIPCKDCAAEIKFERINTIWLDAASKKRAVGGGKLWKRGSQALKQALEMLDVAFMPAATAPGKESQAGLGSDAPLWAALNHLNIKELYQVLNVEQGRGRLHLLTESAYKAHGIYNDRLLAVMAALDYEQLQSASPDDGALEGSHWALATASKDLPEDQKNTYNALCVLQCALVKQPAVPKPQEKSNKPNEKNTPAGSEKLPGGTFGEFVKKGLTAAGIVLTALVLFELAEAIASAIFLEVVIASAAEALKGVAGDKVKEIVTRELKLRVGEISPQQIQQSAEAVYHNLEPWLDSALKVMAH